jgi:hypothetical protein
MYVCMSVCIYACMCACMFFLQHVPLQVVILHAWKDLRTRFTLYKLPSYFRLINMADCVLFFLTWSLRCIGLY